MKLIIFSFILLITRDIAIIASKSPSSILKCPSGKDWELEQLETDKSVEDKKRLNTFIDHHFYDPECDEHCDTGCTACYLSTFGKEVLCIAYD